MNTNRYRETSRGRVLIFVCDECESGEKVQVEKETDGFEAQCEACGTSNMIFTSYSGSGVKAHA